jgi:hypothetical protein
LLSKADVLILPTPHLHHANCRKSTPINKIAIPLLPPPGPTTLYPQTSSKEEKQKLKMADIDESGPSTSEVENREAEEKARKEAEDAEQAKLPYKWTQTIGDADVTMPIPGNLKGRDLDVVLTKTKIKVAVKGQEPIIEVCKQTSRQFSPSTLGLLANLACYVCLGVISSFNSR